MTDATNRGDPNNPPLLPYEIWREPNGRSVLVGVEAVAIARSPHDSDEDRPEAYLYCFPKYQWERADVYQTAAILFAWARAQAHKAILAEAALREDVKRLRGIIETANNALFDAQQDDPEHQIACHVDTLPAEYRRVCAGASRALEVLSAEVLKSLEQPKEQS